MSRYLLVVPPLRGHVAPLLGVATELVARGHEVAWAGAAEWLRPLTGEQPVYGCEFGALPARPSGLRGAAALKFLVQDYLVPMAEAMTPGVDAAIDHFRPDAVLADQHAYAGALAADRHAIVWATSASTSAELVQPFAPKVGEWVRECLTELRVRTNGSPAGADPRFSESLILAFTTPELVGPATAAGRPVRFVGPALAGRTEPPWSSPWSDDAPTVLVTLGTANIDVGARFLAVCAEALAERGDLRAVLVDPGGHLGPQPDTIAVARSVPQLAVLAQSSLVVCHAGHNTVCETLWHGVPLVVAPIRDDQQVVAEQVVNARAGIRLRFSRATADQVGEAVDAALTDPSYAGAARRIRDSFHAAGGTSAAAAHLEALRPARRAGRSTPCPR